MLHYPLTSAVLVDAFLFLSDNKFETFKEIQNTMQKVNKFLTDSHSVATNETSVYKPPSCSGSSWRILAWTRSRGPGRWTRWSLRFSCNRQRFSCRWRSCTRLSTRGLVSMHNHTMSINDLQKNINFQPVTFNSPSIRSWQ